jgi:hypothetical protein
MTVNHPELEAILNKLMNMTGFSHTAEKSRSLKKSYKESASCEPMAVPAKASEVQSDMMMPDLRFRLVTSGVEWGEVFEVLSA